jgi:hypothetical protein
MAVLKDSGCSGGDVAANFYNLVTYSNGINGVEMSVIGHVRLIGFKIADNRDDGIAIQESYGSWGGPMIKASLILHECKCLAFGTIQCLMHGVV